MLFRIFNRATVPIFSFAPFFSGSRPSMPGLYRLHSSPRVPVLGDVKHKFNASFESQRWTYGAISMGSAQQTLRFGGWQINLKKLANEKRPFYTCLQSQKLIRLLKTGSISLKAGISLPMTEYSYGIAERQEISWLPLDSHIVNKDDDWGLWDVRCRGSLTGLIEANLQWNSILQSSKAERIALKPFSCTSRITLIKLSIW